ncbi:MAG TPA: hypothetical protein VKE69_14430, partial [Planctomycetota bacterium]|nr:hypothetical protein [Planctomycetota bacterium]
MHRRRAMRLVGLALAAIAACGGSGSAPIAAQVSIALAPGTLSGAVSIGYSLAGSGSWDVAFAVSSDGGTTWSGASPAAGCATTKDRPAPGAYTFLWDSVADAAAGPVLVRATTGRSTATAPAAIGNAGLVFLDRDATLDASTAPLTLPPLHRGHYDLSPTKLAYLADPAFA